MNNKNVMQQVWLLSLCIIVSFCSAAQSIHRKPFNDQWNFYLGTINGEPSPETFSKYTWRALDLPHDWSIELPFDKESPTGTGGGALRGGTGWYYKTFVLPASAKNRKIYIGFDGVHMNSEVFVNGHSLGKRPNGYISFQYDMTPYVKTGTGKNIIAVKVDNSHQPNSRWYSGSGIYRNVWLTIVNPVHFTQWAGYVTTAQVSTEEAEVHYEATLINESGKEKTVSIQTILFDGENNYAGKGETKITVAADSLFRHIINVKIQQPKLWSVDKPNLYRAVSTAYSEGKILDIYVTRFGIRSFHFDADKGFFLNGQALKIRGVCNHHDLGCLGAAFNRRAAQRQLEILKAMGCNAIRTSHNPPAPELLDLCDEMGFIVMDEAFDMWKKEKTKYDYHLYWDKWYKKDLEDQIFRDRNHPSVFIWSLGNEIGEQWTEEKDPSGKNILTELQRIVRSLDTTRPTVLGNNEVKEWNRLLQANITDMIGYNYAQDKWTTVLEDWYRKPFIVTESVSSLQTRGKYDMPSDSIRIWPVRWDSILHTGNSDTTCSAYDNCHAPWGSGHETSLRILEKYPHISGMFIWTGFDYIGEPTPYPWPARSSYFGIVDLAGFPKDVYYLYQSVWTDKPVLHLFPHWNWKEGQTIDLWAYYNNADEVELFINGRSQGIRKKAGDALHVMWRCKYEAGTAKVISRKNGKTVLTREIKTAGKPAKIILEADRSQLNANGYDLSFITAKIVDAQGILVPYADNEVQFSVKGDVTIAGTDNGSQTDLSSFQSNQRKALHGLCLAVIKSGKKGGEVLVNATAEGLVPATLQLTLK